MTFFSIDRRKGRKNLQDYLRKNHEIFKLQVEILYKKFDSFYFSIKYTLNVKHNEIKRLESQIRDEERALIKAEKHIIEDSALFDQFLDAWSRNANDAASRYDE
jgi:hypothetical protein